LGHDVCMFRFMIAFTLCINHGGGDIPKIQGQIHLQSHPRHLIILRTPLPSSFTIPYVVPSSHIRREEKKKSNWFILKIVYCL
jgi:hypothetical protein